MFYELGADMIREGHQVTVITGFPNHPSGKVFGGYQKRLWQVENRMGMRIIRVWLFTSPNRRLLNRIITFLTFSMTSSIAILLGERHDIMFALLQPLSVGVTFPIIAKLKKTKVVFNLQDLHPDAIIDAGLITNGAFIKFLRLIERFSYRHAEHLCAICNIFKERIVSHGIPSSKISVIPNWIDLDEIRPLPRENAFRLKCGLKPNDFVILYAGNIGYTAGADIIVKVAKMLEKNSEFKFFLVGDGPAKDEIQQLIVKEGLVNVRCFPFQPRDLLPLVQATADVSVVTMQAGWAKKSVGFSSKVLTYMAAGRPVIASVDLDSEMADLVREAKCGIVATAGDAIALGNAIKQLSVSPDSRTSFGANGRRHVEQHFSRDVVVRQHILMFESLISRQKKDH
jgi:colanic acid biosynthesis glycosyl transferase WcaI